METYNWLAQQFEAERPSLQSASQARMTTTDGTTVAFRAVAFSHDGAF